MTALRQSAVWLVAALLAAGWPGGEAPAAEKIVISNWYGYLPDHLLGDFTRTTGIEAELVLHATDEEIMGKITASGGKGFDIVFVSSPFAEALARRGLSARVDRDRIPNLKNLYPEAAKLRYDPDNRYSVPYAWGTTGLCYRADLVSRSPSSWNDLLRPADELKGKITMLSADRWLLGAGLKSLGYSINSLDEDQIRAARDILIDAKRHLLGYDDTTFHAKLASGEAHLAHAWDGWCNYGAMKNDKIRFVVPREGSDLWVDAMVIPKASDKQAAAHSFINYVLRADTGRWVAENILYKVPNRPAMEALDARLYAAYPNLAMTPADLLRLEPMRDVSKVRSAYTRAVTEITTAR